ncbi:MAG: amidohydrolase family protein [Halobacteriales archaeon]
MPDTYDILITDGYLYDRDAVCDVAIQDDRIERIAPTIDGRGVIEIDADGQLVGPGFVDSHVHMDKAYSAAGDRFPKLNDQGTNFGTIAEAGEKHYRETTKDQLEENAVRLGREAVANGTLHMRTHVNVDTDIGTKALEAILGARERLADVLELQIVAMASNGIFATEETPALIREAIEMGADVVGGADPATRGDDTDGAIDTWFDIAREYDVEIDPHIQHPSTLGVNVLHKMADRTDAHDYHDRVTASHSYCLAEMEGLEFDVETPGLVPAELKTFTEGQLDVAIERFADVGMKFVSCHPSTRPGMPIHAFAEHDIPLGWGSDNIHDWVIRHSRPDALQGALANAFKLDYNQYSFASNPGLDLLWRMATDGGAEVMSIEDRYGIEEGRPADLVVFDEPSPQWAVIRQATKRYVIKDGAIVAENGSLTADPI